MWDVSDRDETIDDEYEKRARRENIVIGVIGTIVLVVLQVLLCAWLGVKPHWGPI